MKKEIFSLESLERLRTPEKLDSLLVITSPVTWMALLSMAVLAASIALWGLFGVMSTVVPGFGIIIDSGGVMDVFHDSEGYVDELLVQPGTRVVKGQRLATLSLPSVDNEILVNRARIPISQNQQEAHSNLASYDAVTSKSDVMRHVLSPCDGLILDLDVNPGDFVSAGRTSVCTIRRDYRRSDIRALFYVPAQDGKKVQPGMVVQLTPSEIEDSNSGYLLGVVRTVGLYPATTADMVKFIGNSETASWLLQKNGGAAFEVAIDLIRDDRESGYLWTSSVGKHPDPSPGSIVSGTVVVDRQSPVERLILKVDTWLRAI